MKVLDLRVFENNSWEIILPSSDKIHIKKPTQAMIIKMMKIEQRQKETANNPEEVFNALNDMVADILNFNLEGKKVTKSEIVGFSMAQLEAIIQGYSDFATEINSQDF